MKINMVSTQNQLIYEKTCTFHPSFAWNQQLPTYIIHSTQRNPVPVYDDFVLKPERKNVTVRMFLCMLDIKSMMVAFWKPIACVDTY